MSNIYWSFSLVYIVYWEIPYAWIVYCVCVWAINRVMWFFLLLLCFLFKIYCVRFFFDPEYYYYYFVHTYTYSYTYVLLWWHLIRRIYILTYLLKNRMLSKFYIYVCNEFLSAFSSRKYFLYIRRRKGNWQCKIFLHEITELNTRSRFSRI